MAVEIPVVVDIEGAFEDAASRVKNAIKPLQNALKSENILSFDKVIKQIDDARALIVKLKNELGGVYASRASQNAMPFAESKMRDAVKLLGQVQEAISRIHFNEQINEVSQVNFGLLQMREHYKLIERDAERMSTSINGYNQRLGDLRDKWNSMTLAERSGSEGKAVEAEFRKEISLMQKYAQTLDERLAKEQQVTKAAQEEAKKRADAKAAETARIVKNRQYEETVLKSSIKTIGVLTEQQRILTDRLNRTRIGTDEFRKLQAQIARVNSELKAASGNAKSAAVSLNQMTTAMRSQSPILSSLTSMATSYVSVFGALRFAKQIKEITGELEYQRVALGHLIQDEEYGARIFERIKEAAVQSPFRIKDLVTYTKQLAAYRIETTQLFNVTSRLADVSAGLGVDMNRLILAYGQVRAASVLRGQELRQFTEAGIPLVEMLAEKYTELNGRLVTTGEVFEMISNRAVSFSTIEEIFQDLTDVGGQFYEMQLTQSKTLQGRWEKLKDTFDIALQSIGESEGIINFRNEFDLLYSVLELFAKNIRVVPKILEGMTAGFVVLKIATIGWRREQEKAVISSNMLSTSELKQIVATQGNTVASKLYTRALIKQRVATNALSRSFWKLTAAMAANPIGAILAGVSALIVAFVSFRKKTDEATESSKKLAEWTDVIERQGNIVSGSKRIDSLISRYERLASKTKLTAKEQQSLSQTMRILQGQFKDVTLELGNSNNSVSSQVRKLKELSKQQRETAITTLQLTKAQIEQRLTVLGQEEQDLTKKWLQASRNITPYNDKDTKDLTRRQRKELKALTKDYDEYGDKLNKTSQEINTLQNRLVSIDSILNPQTGGSITQREGDRLSKLRAIISDINNAYKKYLELRKYEGKAEAQKDINTLFPSLSGWEPTYENMLNRLTGMLNQYRGDADATRIIEQAIANIKFDKIKSDFDNQLKKLQESIKQSETARNFFNEMLGLTGDHDLAATLTMSVYGQTGSDLEKELREQLTRAFTLDASKILEKGLNVAAVKAGVDEAIAKGDYVALSDYLDFVADKSKENAKNLVNDRMKDNADWLKDFMKTYQKARTFEERMDTENALRKQKLAEATARGASESDLASINEYYDRKIAEIQLEAIKDTDEWAKAFEDLEGVSTETLDKLITLLDEYIEKYGKVASPGSLRTVVRSREQVNDQRIVRTAYGKTIESIVKYGKALGKVRKTEKGTKEHTEALNESAKELSNISKGVEAIAGSFSMVGNIISELSEFLDLDDLSYLKAGLDGVAKTITLIGTALAAVSALLKVAAPEMLAISAAIALVMSAFKIWQNIRVTKANREIEKQSDLLEDLQYQYTRLEKAIQKSFGSDYITNYNQQLENLAAQQEAYLKQAEAERSKAKNDKQYEKKYKEQTEQYLKSAREVEDQIRDMQSQLSEFFTGTDVTSAAKDFASAWVDAYVQFGSTTDAMSEKFQQTVQEMIQNSLAAKVMQDLLSPIFKEIDRLALEGNELSPEDIAAIAAMAEGSIPRINDSMTALMNTLAAAGYNIRQSPGQFTGISRNIANATEESITGLAAGINTQNFYISTISQNVAAILAVISGGNATPAGSAAVPTGVEWTTHVSMINDNLSALLQAFRSVIYTNGQTVNKYIAVRL